MILKSVIGPGPDTSGRTGDLTHSAGLKLARPLDRKTPMHT